jgi:6-methylsalicylic acid synthase
MSENASTSIFNLCSSSSPPAQTPLPVENDEAAIIGMSCRTAGGNDLPDKLWQFIMDKNVASGESPAWRWDPWIRRDARNANIIAKTISKGYFIDVIECFDAAFFGISPKEAERMDPHQRLGLEVAWEALEHAGLNPKSLSGSDTAVYMGVDSDDYSRLLLEDLPNIEAWMGIGTTAHGIPNRISYHLDLMGASTAVDAACASSLVAVHLGRQAILAGESRVAIMGGVNVCLSPALFHMLGMAGALSTDGFCIAFDDDAHGYARGEGAVVFILKRLSDAIVDGDNVLAILKGSAIAQDGNTNGIIAPNAKTQELVAKKALKQAGVNPLSAGYIEAHATSTSLGDPTEMTAISAVYGTGRPKGIPALVGSIKPNVGHLEAAAGAISLVKAVMAVKKGHVPPQAMLNKLNTRVDWANSGLYVIQEVTNWGGIDGPRRAAICSYGYGGTVSHAIIEQSPQLSLPIRETDGKPTLLLLSAPQGKERLAIQSAAQAQWMSSDGESENLHAIASTLSQRRAHHDFWAAFVVSCHMEAAESLRSFSKGVEHEWASQGRILNSTINKAVVWIFSGHGAQWPKMGLELLKNPSFYNTLAPLDLIVKQELGYSAINCLKSGTFEASDEIQVLTYLVQVGSGHILKSKGTQPQAIIGHSVGEIAASVIAGRLTMEEGTIIVTRRVRLYAKASGLGGMFLIYLPFSEASAELIGSRDVVAAIDSSPSSCVISGAIAPLTKYVQRLKTRGVRTFQVNTDIAFHSPMLEDLSKPFENALSGLIKPRQAVIGLYSTSQADARSMVLRDARYWVQNMVKLVRLTSAINAAVDDSHRIFLEVSTYPIVSQSINETFEHMKSIDAATIPTMRKGQSAERSILHAIAQLHVKGVYIDFSTLFGREWSTEVPRFQWSRKPFWKEVSSGTGAHHLHDVNMHTLIGNCISIAGTDVTVFMTTVEESTKPFPQPHQLHGTNIIPFGVYVNTFHYATGMTNLHDMELKIPLAVTDDLRNVQVLVQGDDIKVASRLSSFSDRSWVTHCHARWNLEPIIPVIPVVDINMIKGRIGTTISNAYSVEYLMKVGVSGMAFPWAVTEHFSNSMEMLVTIDNDPTTETMTWNRLSWAPTVDAASSIGATIFSDDQKLRIISRIGRLRIYAKGPPPKLYHLHVRRSDPSDTQRSHSVDISVLDSHGEVLLHIESMILVEVEAASKARVGMNNLVHRIAWVPACLAEKSLFLGKVVMI